MPHDSERRPPGTDSQGPSPRRVSEAMKERGYCGSVGAPYPCAPYCDPRTEEVHGASIPVDRMKGCQNYDEAVKKLCWVETTLRSPAPVAAGDTIAFSVEVKWWWQVQMTINYGDQVNATFELVDIAYGQSNYNLQILNFLIDGVGTPQNGIDVRRWNFEIFDRFYPYPASGLNDPVVYSYTNVSGGPQDLELGMGGPGVLQIG